MTERFVAWAVLATLILAGGACAETTYRVTKVMSGPQSSGTWNGRGVDEVVEVWGESALRDSDGFGGTILSYMKYRSVQTGEPIAGTSDWIPLVDEEGRAVAGTVPSLGVPSKVALEGKPLARFWVDANGIVYRYWFDDSIYKKDARVYPTSRSEDE